MLDHNKISNMSDEELLKEYEFYREQVQTTFSKGKSTMCLLNLTHLRRELDERNVPYAETTIALSLEFEGDLDCAPKPFEKITIVLEGFDEARIKEAIEKNYYLDLKNLSEEDSMKTLTFFMESIKEETTPLCFPDVSNPFLIGTMSTQKMSYFPEAHTLLVGKTKDGMKKQMAMHSTGRVDYRKFEKRRWV